MTEKLRFPLLFALVLVAAWPVAAQELRVQRGEVQRRGDIWEQEVSCSAPVSDGGRLVLRVDMGSVDVTLGPDHRLTCRALLRIYARSEEAARRLLSEFKLGLRSLDNNGVFLQGRVPSSPMHLKVDYQIQVPRRFNLDLETQGGHLQVEALEGNLKGVTAGGNIRAGDISGTVQAVTAGGNISLEHVGQRLEARTAGGSVRVGDADADAVLETSGGKIAAGRIAGTLRAVTAGGDIVLRGAGADITAQTAGGQIRIGEAGGRVRAETAGGSIQLDAVRGPVQVETAGGCIYLDRVDSAVQAATAAGSIRAQITANADSFGASLLQTSFGDVQVYLPHDLPITIEAVIQNAVGHKIVSDFPLQIDEAGRSFRANTVEGWGKLNGGGQVLRLRTSAGNIEIRRLDQTELKKLQQKEQRLWERLLNWKKQSEEDEDDEN